MNSKEFIHWMSLEMESVGTGFEKILGCLRFRFGSAHSQVILVPTTDGRSLLSSSSSAASGFKGRYLRKFYGISLKA